jgi:SAM-dependent methyltransferase
MTDHRIFVGGMFEEIGSWQLKYLQEEIVIKPEHKFLDIGCGSLRLGRYLIPWLNKGNYIGIESNEEVMNAGIELEMLDAGHITEYTPSFHCNSVFDFQGSVDIAWANSIFSHLTLEDISLCFSKLQGRACVYYFTFFETAGGNRPSNPIESHPNQDFYYEYNQIEEVANATGWTLSRMENQNHPRHQKIIKAIPKEI